MLLAAEPWMLTTDGKILALPTDSGLPFSQRLASLDKATVSELSEHDLKIISPDASTARAIDRASCLLRCAPGLESIVRRCVHEIYILQPPNESFDVSHSDPRWTKRIFVSVPLSSPLANFRVAESIAHEAMHLNL